MSYYIDPSKTTALQVERQILRADCFKTGKHEKTTLVDDNGIIWYTCTGCSKITDNQDMNEPVIKKKKMVVRA